MPNVLDMKGVISGYGPVQVLDRVSIRVKVGEAVSVLGANGAGKTTLLRTISGLLDIRSGSIEIDGQQTTRLTPHRIAHLGVAHVPEGRALFPSLSVMDNLRLGALAGNEPAAGGHAFEHVLELFPWIKSRLRQAAGTLSGGQQQMVAIGRGLMSNPHMLLLDEPSLGLSPKVIDEVYQALGQIRERGVAMLIVEQNAQYGLSFAHYVYVLNRGQVVTAGSPAEIARSVRFNEAYFHGGA